MCSNSSKELIQDLKLSDIDLQFCEKAQRIYETTYNLYSDFDEQYEYANEIYNTLDLLDSLRFSGLRIQKFSLEEKLLIVQKEFICVIADYFSGKYSLELNTKYVRDLLVSEFHIRKISYATIIKKIYDVLDVSDFKEYYVRKVYGQMHKFAIPNPFTNETSFELKNEKLYLYGDFVEMQYRELIHDDYLLVTRKLKYVLNAIQLFETSDDFYNDELNDFYFNPIDLKKDIFQQFIPKTLKQIYSLKLYMNGKFTITFRSKEIAKNFVDMFLDKIK